MNVVPNTRLVLAILCVAGFATGAEAYIGPGAGLSAIGSLIALVGAVVVALAGFVWFPVKRMLKGRAKAAGAPAPAAEPATAQLAVEDEPGAKLEAK